MLKENTLKGIEIGVLIVLIVSAFVVGMIIQMREDKVKIDTWDWVLGLICSFIFSTITYFIVFKWINIGIRIGATVLSSLRAYAIMKFIFSTKGEDSFINMFKKKIGMDKNNNYGNN